MHHDLKQFTDHFQPIVDGRMKAMVRRNDRNFQVGDTVTLLEGLPDATEEGGFKYTGEETSAVITYIDNFGCEPGNVCLSLGRVGLTIVQGLIMKINLNDQPRTIRSVAVVAATGAEVYMLGKIIDGRTVSRISVSDISIEGDPYMHYCGFDAKDELIFTINPHAPCVVEYAS